MANAPSARAEWRCESVTPANWQDLETLFGKRGACGGCWCMWHRLPRREYDASKGDGNRARLKALVDGRSHVGLLAYHESRPIGWCSIAPRTQYRRRIGFPEDDAPEDDAVWAVMCLFVHGSVRRRGLSVVLLRAAVATAAAHGATHVLGSAVVPVKPIVPDLFAFQGLLSAYLRAGFREVERTAPGRATVLWRPRSD